MERIGSNIVSARLNFWVHVGGRDLLVQAGQIWAAGDPVVVDNPSKFLPIRVYSSLTAVAEGETQEDGPTVPAPEPPGKTPQPTQLPPTPPPADNPEPASEPKGPEPTDTTPQSVETPAPAPEPAREPTPIARGSRTARGRGERSRREKTPVTT